MSEPAGLVLDCLGQRCPVPVIELAKAIAEVSIGEVVTVLSDDEAAATDLPAWCRMRGQALELAEPPSYRIRRLV